MTIKCGNCDGIARLVFASKDLNWGITNITFNHYKCSDCGLIFISPLPQDLGMYYRENYYFPKDSEELLRVASLPERFKIELLQSFIRSGRLLEIGPLLALLLILQSKLVFKLR